MNCIDTTKHSMIDTSNEHPEINNVGEASAGGTNESFDGYLTSDVQDKCNLEDVMEDDKNKMITISDSATKMTAKYKEKDSYSSSSSGKSAQNGDRDSVCQTEEQNEEDNAVLKCQKPVNSPSTNPESASSSASDFLQKMVQEQKSQVPTLFCRELPVLNDAASKVYNTMDLKSSAKLFTSLNVPNSLSAADAKFGLHAKRNTTSIFSSAAKNTFVCSEFHNASVSNVNRKSEIGICKYRKASNESGVETSITASDVAVSSLVNVEHATHAESSGKLRFYLDGQFVLELMHAKSRRGTSGSWVQSKGKIWTPVSQSTDVFSRTSSRRSCFTTPNPRPMQSAIADFPSPANSVSSLFMIQTCKLMRFEFLCWLSQNEIRRAARNPTLNLHSTYQTALQRNHPIRSFSEHEFCKNRISVRHKRKTLNDLWKVLKRHKSCSQAQSSTNSFSSLPVVTACKETATRTNKSLLLSALTKPKMKEEKLFENSEDSRSATISPTVTTQSDDILKTPVMMTEESWNYENVNCVKDGTNFGPPSASVYSRMGSTRSRLPEYVPKTSKPESGLSSSSVLLPLPDWYLDPSKAEVPVSEMIGYPRPYFPPVSNDHPLHFTKKRHPESLSVTYPTYVTTNKKLCLKEEEPFKGKCLKSEGSSSAESDLMHGSYPGRWHTKESSMECGSKSTSPPILRCKISDSIDETESSSGLMQRSSNDLDLNARCAKRFGSYGRGHAVSEAIRTYVISDIVNLGGDVESRYVPRGVYPEIASRYKIDVSTTTRWWLRYCADYEQASKRSEMSLPVRKINPILEPVCLKLTEQIDNPSSGVQSLSSNIKSEFASTKMKNPISLKKMYISSHMQENLSMSSSDVNKKHEESTAPSLSQLETHPSREHHSSHVMEDMPLDLSVKRIKIEHPNDPDCEPDIKHYSSPMIIATNKSCNYVHSIPNNSTTPERTSPTDHPTSVYKTTPISNLQRHPTFVADKTNLTRVANTDNFHCNGERTSSPCMELDNDSDLRSTLDVDVHPKKIVVYPPSHQHASPLFASIDSHSPRSSSSKPSDLRSSSSQPTSEKSTSTSQTIQVVTSKQHSSLEFAACDDKRNSKTEPLCLGLNDVHKSDYPSLGVPINGMSSDYSGLSSPPHPPPIALASWPYPPCPMMTYGPALINSYYYCCCFLPGYGQAVDSGNTLAASSPLLVSNGFTKCCPSVADVSPVILDSVYHNNMYKSWEPSISETKVETKSADISLHAAALSETAPEEESPSAQSNTGSMLKHLLLKPSRTTPGPDKSPTLFPSSHTPSSASIASPEETSDSRPASASNISLQRDEEPPTSPAWCQDTCRSPEDDFTSSLSHSMNEENEVDVSAEVVSCRSPEIHVGEDSSDGPLQIVLTDTSEACDCAPESQAKGNCLTNGECTKRSAMLE